MADEAKHYEQAKKHVAEAEARLRRQREIIEKLRAAGSDVSTAQALLDTMSRSLATMRMHLRHIEAELVRELDSLADVIGDILGHCLERGMTVPLSVTCVGANGNTMELRYDQAADTSEFGLTPLAKNSEGGFALPVNITISDRDGKVVGVAIEANRVIRFH